MNIIIIFLLELVCMDFLILELCKGGYKYILVIIDYFIRFVMVILIRN